MFKKQTMTFAALLGSALVMMSSAALAQSAAMAQTATSQKAGTVFGKVYTPVAAVGAKQAQVVYYRPVSPGQAKAAAKVYLDGQLHTALLPNGYSVFCVAAGEHSLGTDKALAARALEGGKTYFMKVREDGTGTPVPVARQDAERELTGTRAQAHALSRASAAQGCEYVPAAR